jgi:site-specific DNA-cytosine methylase
MRILVACEFSGTVRDAFLAQGHDAMSCDLLPTESPGPHYQGDVRDVLGMGWDMMIAHPPCTHLAVSGAKHFHRKAAEQAEALEFVRLLLAAPIERIALENPVSIISTRIRKPDQIIQPWQFGEEKTKTTCLWLKNLPPLMFTEIVSPGAIHTTAGGNRIPTWYSNASNAGGQRAKVRSVFSPNIAAAMAAQWK